MTNCKKEDCFYKKSKIAPKRNDEVWVRSSETCRWELAIFISKTKKGFEVYKYCEPKTEYIDYFTELTTQDPYYSALFIFKSQNI